MRSAFMQSTVCFLLLWFLNLILLFFQEEATKAEQDFLLASGRYVQAQ